MKYEDPGETGREEIQSILDRDDSDELLNMVVSIGLYEDDYDLAYNIVHRLSSHSHYNVKGNAILCFGHLARRFGKLPEEQVKPIIETALNDKEEYIYGQACTAADDVQLFLGWKISGYDEEE